MSKKDKGRIGGPFVPLLCDMLDCPAWRETSHGARMLYVVLKRRAFGNKVYLSFRDAQKALKASSHKIDEWFAELEHYGFIALAQHASLGSDGQGKAAHWRLTEKGQTGATGDLPTKDYLRWTGERFDPKPYRRKHGSEKCGGVAIKDRIKKHKARTKKQNPAVHVDNAVSSTGATPLSSTWETPKSESVVHGGDIRDDLSVVHGGDVSRLTTPVGSCGPLAGDVGFFGITPHSTKDRAA
jgi:hypothetical protein